MYAKTKLSTNGCSLPSVFINILFIAQNHRQIDFITIYSLAFSGIAKIIIVAITLTLASVIFPIWQNLILQNESSATTKNQQKSVFQHSWKLNKHFGNILVCFVFNKQLLHGTAQSRTKNNQTFSAYDLQKACKNNDLRKEIAKSNIKIYALLNNAQLHIQLSTLVIRMVLMFERPEQFASFDWDS